MGLGGQANNLVLDTTHLMHRAVSWRIPSGVAVLAVSTLNAIMGYI